MQKKNENGDKSGFVEDNSYILNHATGSFPNVAPDDINRDSFLISPHSMPGG
jgi:hypothetical protein